MHKPYYSFNQFLQEKIGTRVHKLSLNAGFLCPNLDGTKSTKGCIFCNNKAFSYFAKNEPPALEEQIERVAQFAKYRFKAKKFIAYFQSFTNTYAEILALEKQYSIIKKFPDIVGLSISTRPDCIDKEKLDLIEGFAKDYMVWLELGLQSIHNKSLNFLNRNHTFQDFLAALDLIKGRNILVAAHIILGIPGESKDDMLFTAKVLSKLPLSGLKFHCLHVVKDTPLQELYAQSDIKLLSRDEYVEILVSFLEYIGPECVILRLISEADREFLIAPLWINQRTKVLGKIEEEFLRRGSHQASRYLKT